MPDPKTTLVYADRVIVGDAGLVGAAAITIRGRDIEAVTPLSRSQLQDYSQSGADIVDLGERIVAPAFVNSHTHLAMSALRGLTSVDDMAGNVVEDLFFRSSRRSPSMTSSPLLSLSV
jgi:Predicted metal-dependent hydrolase with the TIM-barrel fold